MSGLIVTATTTKIAITSSSTFRLLQVAAPSNQRVKVLRWGVFFDEETGDATPATPLVVNAGKQTASTGSSTLTALRIPPGSETLQSTCLHTLTTSTLLTVDSSIVNPQTGFEIIYPMGQEVVLAGGEKFGIEVTSGATISTGGLNAIAKIWYEE